MSAEKRRASRGNTHEAYECCGKEPGTYGRPKGSICQECADYITEGKRARERQQAEQQVGTKGIFGWTDQPHWWPRYYGAYSFGRDRAGDALANAMYALVNAVSEPAPAGTPRAKKEGRWQDNRHVGHEPWPYFIAVKKNHSSDYQHTVFVQAAPQVQVAIDALDSAIRDALADTFQEGKHQGSSVLFQLASGEVTLTDFDDAIVTPEERAERQKKRRGY